MPETPGAPGLRAPATPDSRAGLLVTTEIIPLLLERDGLVFCRDAVLPELYVEGGDRRKKRRGLRLTGLRERDRRGRDAPSRARRVGAYWRSEEMNGRSRRSTSRRIASGKHSRCSRRGSLRIESIKGDTARSDR